jgi:sec-independent protein translocase protein TatC
VTSIVPGRLRKPKNLDGTMSLVEHLTELRRRMFISALALVVGMIIGYLVFPHVFHVLEEPYCKVPNVRRHEVNGQCTLNAFNILDPFKIKLQISFFTGLVLASPVWLWQLWGFVTPGLYKHERRWSGFFVAASIVLFALGGFLGYRVLSTSLRALLGITGSSINNLISVDSYLSYVQGMLIVFSAAFEFPLLLIMLTAVGLLSGRKLLRWWRGVVFGIVVFTAIAVPSPDPFSVLALAIPLVGLFFVSVGVCHVIDLRRTRKRRAEDQRIADELGIDVDTLNVPFVDVPLD